MLMHAHVWQPLIQAWGRVWVCACVCLLCGEAPAGVEGGVEWGRRGMRRRRRIIAGKAGDLRALTFTPCPPLLVSVSLWGPRQDEAVVHTLHAKEWNGVRRIFCKLKDLPNIWANHSFYSADWRFRTSSTRKVSTKYQNGLIMNGKQKRRIKKCSPLLFDFTLPPVSPYPKTHSPGHHWNYLALSPIKRFPLKNFTEMKKRVNGNQ